MRAPFCTDCVVKYIRVKIEDEYTGDIKCPAPNCDHTLDPLACAPLVSPALFLRWCDILCEAAVMGWESCYCPYGDCKALILNECGGRLRLSTCPKFKGLFCFRCGTVWHPWLTCRESRDEEGLRRLAALKGWKRCPLCGIFVERAGGCPTMRCRCGMSFCYDRGRAVLYVGTLVVCLAVVLTLLGFLAYTLQTNNLVL